MARVFDLCFIASRKTPVSAYIRRRFVIACGASIALLGSALMAYPLDVAQSKLELTPTVANNLFFLLDNSGSMDFEVVTEDYLSSGLLLSAQPDGRDLSSPASERQIMHRAGCEQEAALFGGYAYGVASPSNAYQSVGDCYVAAADAWRFRNAQFNPLYFDPSLQYAPWPGVDINGDSYPDYRQSDANSSLLVPLNPYDPAMGLVDLLANNPVTGGFRFYEWNDDGDGDFENGEQQQHLLSAQSVVIKGNFANWFVYHRSRFLRAKGAIAHAVVQAEVTRAGLAVTQSGAARGNIPIMDLDPNPEGIDKREFLDRLYATEIDPLVRVFPSDASQIFEDNNVFPDQFNAGTPLRIRINQTREYMSCEAANESLALFDTVDCPVFGSNQGGSCQAHQLIVISDGFYNGLRPGPGGNEDASTGGTHLDAFPNRSAFDGGAFADGVSQSLADQAMRAYKTDFEGDARGRSNELIPTPEDRLRYPRNSEFDSAARLHQHVKTHVLTFGLENVERSFPQDPTSSFSWLQPSASNRGLLEDMHHAAYNGRGDLMLLNEGQVANTQVVDRLRESARHLAFPLEQPVTTQALVGDQFFYQAVFDPAENIGDIVAYAVRPDGGFTESPAWSAATLLDSKINPNDDSRNLFTYSDDGATPAEGRLFQVSGSGVNAQQLALLNQPAPANTGPIASARLDYLRGQYANEGTRFDEGEFRERPQIAGKIGPIENSRPILVGAPLARGRLGGAWPGDDNSYFNFQRDQADRDPLLYVGSNSGIFHALDASTGEERFGYIPNLVFTNLSDLTRPEYRHRFYVDGNPVVNDVFIRTDGSPDWHTVLIGGLGAGGRGYFALDVTDPNGFDQDSVLWEFSTQDDPVDGLNGEQGSHLGLSLGEVQMVMTNSAHFSSSDEKQWAAVFGNGVNNTSADGNAVVYIVFIDDLDANNKPRMIKIDTGVGYSSDFDTPNGIIEVRAVDVDGNGTADRLYAGDIQGHLYAIDISDENPNQWTDEPNIIFATGLNGSNQADERQAITTRPIVLPHPTRNGLLVSFSTGTFFLNGDATDDEVQSIYGIWDDFSGERVRFDDLVEQEFTDRVNPNTETAADISVVRTITDNPVNWGQGDQGWYVNLDVASVDSSSSNAGERVIEHPVLLGGNLFLSTSLPREDSCNPGGGGFNLAINPLTGGSPNDVVFDANIDGVFDVQDSIQVADSLEIVAGTRNDSAIRTTIFFGGRLGIVNELGELFSIGLNLRDDRYLGRRAWREIEDYDE